MERKVLTSGPLVPSKPSHRVPIAAWIAAWAFAVLPIAQAQGPARSGGPGDDTVGLRYELRAVERLRKAMREELRLGEETLHDVDDLFEDHVSDLKDLYRRVQENADRNAGRLQDLQRSLQTARNARDAKKMHQLRTQIKELRSDRSEIQRAIWEFDKKVVEVLEADQAEAYRKLVLKHRSQSSENRNPLAMFATVSQIARKLELSEGQRGALQKLMLDMARGYAEARDNPEQADDQQQQFRQQVLDLLTEEQRRRFLVLEQEEHAAKPTAPPAARTKKGERE